ncbi:hypothetical protein [Archangium sp.]|jgi:hypothetical protein|uniref:hypothetical protein n=1 Tax=Archangium sp. TaxID=1872627 RepID=UPI002ED81E52
MNSLLRLFLLCSVRGLLACASGPSPVDDESPDAGAPSSDAGACVAVIRYARPAAGGDCELFASPCDVPQGHVVCCGGLAYGACLGQNAKCVDDTTDTCHPESASDCPGICQP